MPKSGISCEIPLCPTHDKSLQGRWFPHIEVIRNDPRRAEPGPPPTGSLAVRSAIAILRCGRRSLCEQLLEASSDRRRSDVAIITLIWLNMERGGRKAERPERK